MAGKFKVRPIAGHEPVPRFIDPDDSNGCPLVKLDFTHVRICVTITLLTSQLIRVR